MATLKIEVTYKACTINPFHRQIQEAAATVDEIHGATT